MAGVRGGRRHLSKAEPVAVRRELEGRGGEEGSPAITQFTPPPPLFVRFVLRSTNGQRGRRAKSPRERQRRRQRETSSSSTHTLRSAHNYLVMAEGGGGPRTGAGWRRAVSGGCIVK